MTCMGSRSWPRGDGRARAPGEGGIVHNRSRTIPRIASGFLRRFDLLCAVSGLRHWMPAKLQ